MEVCTLAATRAHVRLFGSRGATELLLIVDTGSTDTWINREVLEQAGLMPSLTRDCRTRNNARVRRQVGHVEIECLGIRMPCPVVFADEEDTNVLGATALGILGLEVDPTTHDVRRRKELAAYWLTKKRRGGDRVFSSHPRASATMLSLLGPW